MRKVHPAMVTLARESRGHTQSSLADAIGIEQGTISKVENEQISPSEELLKRLAEFLDYPIEFFYDEEPIRNLPTTFYRKRISTSKKTLNSIAAQLNIVRMHVRKLLNSAEIPDVGFSRVDLKDLRGNVEQVATDIRRQWNLPSGPIKNVTKLLEDAGILIVDSDFGTNKVDGMSIYDSTDTLPPMIFINPRMPGDRCRFTLCHEFAHILFHHHLPPLSYDVDMEGQANRFASEFLMPTRDIKPFLTRPTLKNLAGLKPHWKVAIQALLMKSYALGFLSERQKRHLWMQMGALGYRTNEPFPIPREEPTLLREVVQFHLKDLNYTDGQLAKVIRLNKGEFKKTYLGLKAPDLRIVNVSKTKSA